MQIPARHSQFESFSSSCLHWFKTEYKITDKIINWENTFLLIWVRSLIMKYFIHFILFYPFVLIDFWFELWWHMCLYCVFWECVFIIFEKKIIKFKNIKRPWIHCISVCEEDSIWQIDSMLAAFSFMPSKKINNNIFIWLFLFYFFFSMLSLMATWVLSKYITMIWNKGEKNHCKHHSKANHSNCEIYQLV